MTAIFAFLSLFQMSHLMCTKVENLKCEASDWNLKLNFALQIQVWKIVFHFMAAIWTWQFFILPHRFLFCYFIVSVSLYFIALIILSMQKIMWIWVCKSSTANKTRGQELFVYIFGEISKDSLNTITVFPQFFIFYNFIL
jgi:hypothetical protein